MSNFILENAQHRLALEHKLGDSFNFVDGEERDRLTGLGSVMFYYCIDDMTVDAVAIYENDGELLVLAVDRYYSVKNFNWEILEGLARDLVRLNYVYGLTL